MGAHYPVAAVHMAPKIGSTAFALHSYFFDADESAGQAALGCASARSTSKLELPEQGQGYEEKTGKRQRQNQILVQRYSQEHELHDVYQKT